MTLNVNTNSAALSALANLNTTTNNLTTVTGEISSGFAVADAKDNPAVYTIAQQQRADIQNLKSVTEGLNRAQSISDVAVSAGGSVSDLLNTLKSDALAATDQSLDTTSLDALNSNFQAILEQIQQTVSAASFNGDNLLDGSLTSGLSFMANADASSSITLTGMNLALGGTTISVPSNGDISTPTAASQMLTLVESSITNVNAGLAALGAQSSQVTAHASVVSLLSDSLTTGVGDLVDADVAAESARLTALQVQQQLGAQVLSIANQMPQTILQLFSAH